MDNVFEGKMESTTADNSSIDIYTDMITEKAERHKVLHSAINNDIKILKLSSS